MNEKTEKIEKLQAAGLRLGQIFENIRIKKGDLFYISDKEISIELDKMIGELSYPKKGAKDD